MPLMPENGELHINQHTGKPFIRQPAGGTGGGATSFADTPATGEQHVGFLENEVKFKEGELANAKQRHEKASKEHQKHKAAQAKRDEQEKKAEEARIRAEGDTGEDGLDRLTEKRQQVVEDERAEAHTADAEGRSPIRPLDRKTEGLSDDTGPIQNTGQPSNPHDRPQAHPIPDLWD
jgi:hypothetical protein